MLNKSISYYKNAKDNKGTTVTIRNVFDQIITDTYLKEITQSLREIYIPPVQKATAAFVAYVADHSQEWAHIVSIRKNIQDTKRKIKALENKKGDIDHAQISQLEADIAFYNDELDNASKNAVYAELLHLEKVKLAAEAKRDTFKTTNFPGVTWAGTFTKRNASKIAGVSGLIVMDIDKLTSEQHDSFKKLLKHDPYIFFLFTSPSGNGLKLVFIIDTDAADHLDYFEAIGEYLQQEYKLTIDPSGKDKSRLCFLPYDSDAFYNEKAKGFPVPVKKEKPAVLRVDRSVVKTTDSAYDVIEFTQGFVTKDNGEMNYVPGNRNNFIFLYARNCYRKGIPYEECLQVGIDFANDLPETEVTTTIKSAYKDDEKNPNEFFGMYAKKDKSVLPTKETAQVIQQDNRPEPTDRTAMAPQPRNDESKRQVKKTFAQFWYFHETEGKDGRKKKIFELDYNKLKVFLTQQGFYRLRIDDVNYQFIRIVGNRVKPITTLQIKDFLFDYLQELGEFDVMNSLTRGGKQFFSVDKFERLEYKEVSVKRHTEKEAFFYYQNGVVKVTPDNIVLLPYDQIGDTYIWDSSVNRRSVTILPDETDEATSFPDKLIQSEIYRFIWLACCNDKNAPEDITDKQKADWYQDHLGKFGAHCTAIGYLLHRYKVPSKAKAIVAIDHQIPNDFAEQNGGTGKSIVGNYILRNMMKVATIPGKDYKDENPWRWEPITIDSQIVFFNDVKRNFNFEGIFELITDDMTINRRNIGYLTIPFEDSPKPFIATNFIPRGEGSSFKRRMAVIEFDNYFNDQHTPYDEFGHNLFQDWKGDLAEQWNLYDNFMWRCVQMYLQEGLLDYPSGNYDKRKLVSECPQEFIDWLDATDETGKPKNVQHNSWVEKKFIIKGWIEEAKSFNLPAPSPHVFTKMVKKYCAVRELTFNSKKTNGAEYYCFGNIPASSPTATQTTLL